ncbi:hypothetical protein ACTXT7_000905 [Hymenolepis weldensis]
MPSSSKVFPSPFLQSIKELRMPKFSSHGLHILFLLTLLIQLSPTVYIGDIDIFILKWFYGDATLTSEVLLSASLNIQPILMVFGILHASLCIDEKYILTYAIQIAIMTLDEPSSVTILELKTVMGIDAPLILISTTCKKREDSQLHISGVLTPPHTFTQFALASFLSLPLLFG